MHSSEVPHPALGPTLGEVGRIDTCVGGASRVEFACVPWGMLDMAVIGLLSIQPDIRKLQGLSPSHTHTHIHTFLFLLYEPAKEAGADFLRRRNSILCFYREPGSMQVT